jgi:hypothetical protein
MEAYAADPVLDAKRVRAAVKIGAAFALVKLLTHLLTNGHYGWFRDEMYFRVCADHLDWGYPDHAPLSILAAWLGRHIFGGSLNEFRFLPAVSGAAKMLLTAWLAAEMGGGAIAAALACLCVLVTPVYLINDTLFSMNTFEPLFWMGAALLVLRGIRLRRPNLFLWAGLVAGLGLENKHSAVFFLIALAGGLAISPSRRIFREPKLRLGIGIAFLCAVPNLIWQYRHNWATLELLLNVKSMGKNVVLPPPKFLAQQALMLMPFSLPVWLAGLWLTLKRRDLRFLGLTYLILLAMMMAMAAKDYYLAPAYLMLFAAGGLWWEARKVRWAPIALGALVLLGGMVGLPMALPILTPEALLGYMNRLGIQPTKTEVHHTGPFPQYFGDQFGWPEEVEKVAQAWQQLKPEERPRAAILAGNYGEAGAIDLYGPRYGLPKAVTPHQSYWLWGPGKATGEVLIVLQRRREDLERHCAAVEDGPEIGHPFAMGEEHFRIYICRGLDRPLSEVWPSIKVWN